MPAARGLAVATLILGQLVLVVSARSPTRPLWRASPRANPTLAPVLGAALLSLLAAALELTPLSATRWLLAGAVAAAVTLGIEPIKARIGGG